MRLFEKGQSYKSFLIQIKEKHYSFLLMLLLLCVGFLTFKKYLLFENLYIFLDIGSDPYNLGYPHFVNIADYIRNEGLPCWSFYTGMGQNIFPGGINNPFKLILYILGREYLAYGIAYVELLKIIIAGIIFYYYLKILSLSPFTRIIGSILIAFSGYMVLGSGWYGHSTFVVFGIFFLFSFEKLFKDNVWYYVPISVALITSRSSFYLYILAAFIALYSIFRIVDEGNWSLKRTGLFYLKLAGAGFLGVALVAPFIVNDLLRMMESPRVGGDASYSGLLKSVPIFSFAGYLQNVTAVLRFFSNDILGAGSNYKGWYNYLEAPAFYCGLSTLLLFPQIFSLLSKKKKVIYFLFLSIWTLIIVFPFFRYGFYLFTGDYYKGGLSFIIPVILLFYSLHALDQIDKAGKKINKPLLLVSLGVFLCILYFPFSPGGSNPVNESVRLMITGFLICYSLIFLLYENGRNYKIVRYSLLIIICFEASLFSSITSNSRLALTVEENNQSIGYNDGTKEIVEFIKSNDDSFFRISKNYSSGIAIRSSLNDALIQNYYGTTSYNSFNQKYYIRFLIETGTIKGDKESRTRWATGLKSRPFLQTIASVKYFFTKTGLPEFYKITYKPFIRYNNITVFQNNYFLPLGFTYNKYIPYDQFKGLGDSQKDRVLFKAFVLERDGDFPSGFKPVNIDDFKGDYSVEEYGADVKNLKQESMIITEQSQNNIKGHIDIKEQRKMLFFSIPYDKGWNIKVDGVKQKVNLINIGFMGVVIPEGEHQIELTYTPPFLLEGISIMSVSMLLYLFLIFLTFKKENSIAHKKRTL